ncbi:MAG: hypothetical protein GY940_17390 [bacterium]|nr:hypothetical protein [bacterium]
MKNVTKQTVTNEESKMEQTNVEVLSLKDLSFIRGGDDPNAENGGGEG